MLNDVVPDIVAYRLTIDPSKPIFTLNTSPKSLYSPSKRIVKRLKVRYKQ